MLLTWPTALKMSIALIVLGLVLSMMRRWRLAPVIATANELAIVLGLYALWQWAKSMGITKVRGARENALSLWHFERAIHLPNELTIQRWFDHPVPMQFLNVYYAVAHVPAAGILLAWLFFRHRDRYSRVRTTFALSILGCLLIQTIPYAPPRFFPELGFVDSGLKYGQSVYGRGGSGISNQLAAMPSQHVGWALLVGIVAVCISRSRWRWLVLLHPLLTILSVTATANHWLMDGVVAGAVLGVAYGVVLCFARFRARLVHQPGVPVGGPAEPAFADAV